MKKPENKKAWTAIRQMVCVHFGCSDGNDEMFPKCKLKNLYPECPFHNHGIEYLITSALKIANKFQEKTDEYK